MQETMRVKTSQKFEVVDLTAKVADAVGRSGVVEGLCTVFVRHATAAIVINENADAGFRHDIIAALDKLFPQGVWQHDKVDDNGAAHLKAAVLGPSEAIPIGGGRLLLGTWQGIALVECDGPRERQVVDDDHGVRESFRLILEDRYEVLEAADGRQALERLRASPVDLVLLDIRLPEMDGIEVLERMKAVDDGVEVILVTAVKTVRIAVDAMKLGAFDYLTKPFDEDELLSLIRRALEKRSLEREVAFLRSELARRHDFDELVGQHPEMQKLYRLISQVARTTTTVVITGESGTGKELIARAIHRQGPRRDKPFVAVNPAALSDSLVESELFGHEKGAFTGAYQRKLGRFELAQGGTLFLDEISSLKPELQAKLLRV